MFRFSYVCAALLVAVLSWILFTLPIGFQRWEPPPPPQVVLFSMDTTGSVDMSAKTETLQRTLTWFWKPYGSLCVAEYFDPLVVG